jgi:hypothetical protein
MRGLNLELKEGRAILKMGCFSRLEGADARVARKRGLLSNSYSSARFIHTLIGQLREVHDDAAQYFVFPDFHILSPSLNAREIYIPNKFIYNAITHPHLYLRPSAAAGFRKQSPFSLTPGKKPRQKYTRSFYLTGCCLKLFSKKKTI